MKYSFLLQARKAVATRSVKRNIQGIDGSKEIKEEEQPSKLQVSPAKRQLQQPTPKKK